MHQFVAEGQVEPGLADIALPARPAPQLVVDAARLVAFGADHVQPAQGDHLLGLGRHGGLGPAGVPRARPARSPSGVSIGSRSRLAEPLVDEEVHVAAEHDIGSPTGHFGGDGDRTEPAGPRDGRLLIVVLGVEDGVRNVQFLRVPGQVLDFPTLAVPINTGWPLPWRSATSPITAWNWPVRSCRRRRLCPAGTVGFGWEW